MTLTDQHCSTCVHFDGVVCHAFATLVVASGWCPRWVDEERFPDRLAQLNSREGRNYDRMDSGETS
jgi:hypothetical protein